MFLGVSLRDRVGWMGLEQGQRVCILAWFWCVWMLSMVNSPQPEHWSIHRGLQSWLHVTAKYKITQMLGLIWNQQNQNPWRWVCSQNPCLCLHKLGNTSCPTSPSPIHTENSEQSEGTRSPGLLFLQPIQLSLLTWPAPNACPGDVFDNNGAHSQFPDGTSSALIEGL